MAFRVTLVLGELPHFGEPYGGAFAHGLASITAVLREAGIRVDLLHLVEPPTEEGFQRRLAETNPDLIGFSSISHLFPMVKRWAGWAKATRNTPIVVGGVHAILNPEDVISVPEVDHVCLGEGEHALLELCRSMEAGESTHDIAGLWSKQGGEVRRAPQRPLITGLDDLPLPDYSIFRFDRLYLTGQGSISVMLSRGCPYRCSYCANHRIKGSYPNPRVYTRFYSVERALEIIERLLGDHPETREIVFNDNIIYPDKTWLREFSAAYGDRVGLPFTANTRPNLVDAETVELLRAAGCRRICMGVESGDEHIANRVLRRGQNNQVIRRAFALFRAAGIETVSYNILGSPFETLTTMLRTVHLNAEIRPTFLSPFVFYPFPGTEGYDISRDHGFLTERHGFHNSEGVMIRQPTVSEDEVLFLHRFFRPLVRTYGRLDALPRWLGAPLARGLDAAIGSRLMPRGALVSAKERHSGFRMRRALLREAEAVRHTQGDAAPKTQERRLGTGPRRLQSGATPRN